MIKFTTLLCVLLSLISLHTNAQISQINLLNKDYSHGLKPTNIQANDSRDAYISWRNKYAVTCSNNRYRIKFDSPNENQTVSEGIAYGMLLSAYANDKELFDGLWLYYKDFSNSNGVMNWKINGCSNVIGNNGATDAELDAAIGLMTADKRWGNSGAINYKNEATTLINTIKVHEVESGSFVLKPGDAWGGSINTNPSYFATGYFRAFGEYTNDTTFWNAVADKSYDIINANLSKNNAVYNLVSDWCEADGDYSTQVDWAHNRGRSYYYDAARTPWRIAVDFIWYGSLDALQYLNLCNDFVNNEGGFGGIHPGYNQDGTPVATNYTDPVFTGAYANAAMSSTNQTFVNNGYSTLKSQINNVYFADTLRAIYLFVMSGNGYNPLDLNTLSSDNVVDDNGVINQTSFDVYPNPTTSTLNVNFNFPEERTIRLYTVTGTEIMSLKTNANSKEIDLSSLNSGVYFLSVGNKNRKIVKL